MERIAGVSNTVLPDTHTTIYERNVFVRRTLEAAWAMTTACSEVSG